MSNDLIRTAEEVREQRRVVEAGIAECQEIVGHFVAWRESIGAEFHRLADVAVHAVERHDQLLLRIEQEALWAFDYESATDYYDANGFSRQRMHQIRTEVIWKQLVGDLDEHLPLPTGHLSRYFGSTSPDIALPAYQKAVQESGGMPSEGSVKEWMAAAKEIDIQDNNAVAIWRDRKHVAEIERHFKALRTEEAREEIRKLLL